VFKDETGNLSSTTYAIVRNVTTELPVRRPTVDRQNKRSFWQEWAVSGAAVVAETERGLI